MSAKSAGMGMSADRVRQLLADGGRSLFEVGKGARIPAAAAGVPEWFGAEPAALAVNVVVEVTPQLAGILLERNDRNRHPSAAKIRRYAAMIRDKQWDLNGETLKFSDSGRLLDGQSRLRAVIEAGEAVLMECRFGLPENTQQTMDTGEKRSLPHELEMRGEKDCTNLAAIIRGVHLWLHGAYTARYASGGSVHGEKSYYMTNRQGVELLEQYPQLRDSLKACRNPECETVLSPGKLGVLHFLFRKGHRREYMWEVLRGHSATDGCPVLWVKNRVIAGRLEDNRIPVRMVIGMLIKAHNKLVLGEAGACAMRKDEALPDILRTSTKTLTPEDLK